MQRPRLASLFDEELPDLLAASCLSRRTLEHVRRTDHRDYEPLPETLEALERAMRLLDPVHPESIAGWRELLSSEELALMMGTTPADAQDRLRGRRTWTEAERARLITSMAARRAR